LFREKVYPVTKEATALRCGGAAARRRGGAAAAYYIFQEVPLALHKSCFSKLQVTTTNFKFLRLPDVQESGKKQYALPALASALCNKCQIINPHFKLRSRSVQITFLRGIRK
jgi:hypothetical protein